MARAGETPTAAYQGLDYGQNVAANQMAEMIDPSYDPLADYTPENVDMEFLTSPTDRPQEPLSHGAPFGPGADFTPHQFTNDASMMRQVVQRMAAAPGADAEVKAFADRVARGL